MPCVCVKAEHGAVRGARAPARHLATGLIESSEHVWALLQYGPTTSVQSEASNLEELASNNPLAGSAISSRSGAPRVTGKNFQICLGVPPLKVASGISGVGGRRKVMAPHWQLGAQCWLRR